MGHLLQRSVDCIPWWLRDRIRKIPLVASAQRRFVERWLNGREFVHTISAGPARGLVFPVNLPEDKLIWTGTLERQVTETIAGRVRRGHTCFDVGSHRGFMAGVMALASRSRVYCFEPDPANLSHLTRLAALNPALEIEALGLALGARDQEADFLLMPQSSMGKLGEVEFQRDAGYVGSIQVSVRRLDSLIAARRVPIPDFIKIDVEGAEALVLQGASQLIAAYAPELLIEVHTRALARQCTDLLDAHDYRTAVIEDGVDALSGERFGVCHLHARARTD